ncbi:hypothetical protein KR038_011890, partial [Drosophila bunnanda]
ETMKAVVAIILIFGIRGYQTIREPLSRLNDVLTTRIKEILKEHALDELPSHYISLQRAAELPIFLLDKKIEAYNTLKVMQETEFLVPINSTIYSGRASGAHHEPSRFESKLLKLIKKLGIRDNFTARVFKAIFSDEKQLKKLKMKLDELEKDDMNSNSDSLWDFIIDML